MNKEDLKKAIDIVSGIEVHSEAEAIAKETLISYIELKDKVIDEAMEYFIEDCPYSIAFKDEEEYKKVQNLCNCENCQDDYKKCWLKYFENEILERGKNVNSK